MKRAAACVAIALTAVWCVLALFYLGPGETTVSHCLDAATAGAASVMTMFAIARPRWQRVARSLLAWWMVASATLLIGFALVPPLQQRDWADDVARIAFAEVDGSHVTLHDVRDFDWRSDTDYTQRWQTREYDLDHIESVDLAMSYWMGPAIAHTLVSFGFGNDRYLTFSIEIRRERGEEFSALAGFFKQYEMALIAADEHDILRVRTNVRGEDMYLYRIDMPREAMRALFLAYLDEAAQLRQTPRFYNTLTANCTTIIYHLTREIGAGLPMDWRVLVSGYLPEYLQRAGALTPGEDIETLRARGRVTDRAKAIDAAQPGDSVAFSRAIRTGVPGITGPR